MQIPAHGSLFFNQGDLPMKLPKLPTNLGMRLLAIWLIFFAALTSPTLHLRFAHSDDMLAVLAVIVACLLLFQR